VKAYSAESILKSLQENFLIEDIVKKEEIKEEVADDQKDYEKPKTRNGKVFVEKKV
tara:strand:+ start:785 stop:952 length:168 start_codon:yes stop_codon:yes gene_type:complete